MLIGAALAVIVTLHGPLRSRAGRRLLSVGAVIGFVVVVLPWFATNATRVHDLFYGRFGLLAYSVASAVVIWRLTQPSPGALGRALELRPMRWVGDISYEMYLWHWPLYLVLTPDRLGLGGLGLLAVRLSAVVALSAVTHFYVGEPIRRGVRLRSPRLARIATVGVVVAVGVGVFAATLDLTSGAERRGRRGGAGRWAARGPECRARPRARWSRRRRGTGTGRAPEPGEGAGGRRLPGGDARPGPRRRSGRARTVGAAGARGVEPRHPGLFDHHRPDVRHRRRPRREPLRGSQRVAAAMGE